MELPFDMSEVMFIATANRLETISGPMLDRMEVIEFPSYTQRERLEIAKLHLLPKNLHDHGIPADRATVSDSALHALVSEYTWEAGVRGLDRELAALCRKIARKIAESESDGITVETSDLEQYVGRSKVRSRKVDRDREIGVANALVVSQAGGQISPVEVSILAPLGAEPQIRLTGNLGPTMKESATTAFTCVRALLETQNAARALIADVHVHVPEGGVPKDGPSAGLSIAIAMISAAQAIPVRGDVALTGELTLHGKVLPIGGLRDKILAAHQAGMKVVLFPKDNESELEELPDEVKLELNLVPLNRLDEAIDWALAKPSDAVSEMVSSTSKKRLGFPQVP
jgi:ATP-dependent Lon protease